MQLVPEPHISDAHLVLGERARLVGADGGARAQGLDGLQVLHEAILLHHTLRRQREGSRHRWLETLR